MTDLEVIADYGDLCGEGPVWDPATRVLYWTDMVGKRFYRYDAASERHEILYRGLAIHAFRLREQGGFVIANGDGIWLWDGAAQVTLVASQIAGASLAINDCAADPAGRLVAGSTFYDPAGDYELGKLVVADTDGSVRLLDEGFHLSNGLGFSPDGRTLYFADSMARSIYEYTYDVSAGAVSRRRLLVRVPDNEGIPDGLAVDAEGYIWSAQWYGGCIVRYDPDGRPERRIAVPVKQVSAVAFGGDALTDLFITSAAESSPAPAMPPGYDPNTGPFGGPLFRTRLEIPGRPEPRVKI